MKKFLLLFLLGCWSHVGAKDVECNTGVVFVGHAISVRSSQSAGSHVLLLRAYTAPRLYDCLEDCCFAKYGICSVAEFRNDTEESNCLHYSCHPLHNCKFMKTKGKDSFTFPGYSKEYVPRQNVIEGENVELRKDYLSHSGDPSTEAKEHTRAVSARKGVEMSTPRAEKETFSNFTKAITVDGDTPSFHKIAFKNDNTTIKPRKGVVDPLGEKYSSGIKPRKGVDMHRPSQTAAETGKSKVKPRKGVEQFTISPDVTTTIMPSSKSGTTSAPIKSSNASNPGGTTPQSEFMSMLEQIFLDDPSYANSSTKIFNSSRTLSSSPQSVTISPTPIIQASVVVSELSSMSSIRNPITEPSTPLTALPTNALFPSKAVADHLNTPVNAQPTSAQSKTSHLDSISTESSKISHEEVQSSAVSTVQDFTSTPADLLPIRTTSKMTAADFANTTRFVLSQTMSDVNAENERKYKSSMHLVLSLVFGLLVLLVVLGAVAKRVYDVWMRRHYHRMDFLIDGMYDGYS